MKQSPKSSFINVQKNGVYSDEIEPWKLWTKEYQEELRAGVQDSEERDEVQVVWCLFTHSTKP